MHWLDALRQDIAYAVRSLRRAPGVTIGVVLTLALGLGVNMAMFSFLDVVFLRPPPGVRDPHDVRRVWMYMEFVNGSQYWSGYSYPQYDAIQSALGDRVATALYLSPRQTRFGQAADQSQVRVSYASASYFDLLGARPSAGRLYTADEDRLGAGVNVAVASHAFWQRHFGGDADAIGREVYVAGRPYTLIGVAAEKFGGVELEATELWVPIASFPPRGPAPWWRRGIVNGFQILLRPKAGAVGDVAMQERITMALSTVEDQAGPAGSEARLASIIRARGPGRTTQEVKMATRLAGVTIIVLIIACANVTNLLLARAVQRRREIAVRLALGISRSRLVRLLLTESVLLAVAAAAGALLAAYWGGALLRGALMPDVQFAASLMHWRVIGLALGAGLGAGIIAGILPAMQSTKTELTDALKGVSGSSDAARGKAGDARGERGRTELVLAQTALSVVLLVGAALFVRSLSNIRERRIGFDASQIVYGGVSWDTRDSLRDARFGPALRELAGSLRQAPGVEEVALASMVPKRGLGFIAFYPDVDTTRIRRPFASYTLVSPEFFAATGMRMRRGEDFPRGVGSAMPPVVVVNEAMAQAQWPGMDAVGRCMRFAPDGECYRVIGVVETALVDKLIENPRPQFYLPIDNPPDSAGNWFGTLVVRTQPRAINVVSMQLRRTLLETFPGGRPWLTTMDELLDPEYRPWRLGAMLFTAFGLLALIVAAVGIYSTVAYMVAQRTHEFGIRAALGAHVMDILAHVLERSLRTVLIGVAIGVVLAVAAGQLVVSLLYDIEPSDPGVLIGVALAMLLIAVVAALGPAWRAARVDPMTALRAE